MSASIGERISIARIIAAFGFLLFASLSTVAGLSLYGIATVGIGGAAYDEVIAGKDLIGDILPPPEYIIEAYLEANLLLNHHGDVGGHVTRLAELEKQFDGRRAYWKASILPETLRRDLTETAGGDADRFWTEVKTALLPAVQRGDGKLMAESFDRLSAHYAKHRAAIDEVVVKANAYASEVESAAKRATPVMTMSIAVIALIMAVLIACGLALLVWLVLRPLAAVARKLSELATASLRREAEAKAQASLDAHLEALRDGVFSLGAPRRDGDKLYFGDLLINGNNEMVDRIKERFGSTATIFLDDLRIATNVLQPNGSRATGTRLAAGPAAQSVLGKGRMYRGEAQIFEKPYLTIYEPIMIGREVVGILYVGVPKQVSALQKKASNDPALGNEVARMRRAIDVLLEATEAKDTAERAAMDQRYLSTDAVRRASSLQIMASSEQRLVVDSLSKALESLAATDFTHRIAAEFPEDYRALRTNFAAAVTILRDTMRAVNAQAQSIFGVSGSLSQAADDLSRRTEQQAASLEQTSAALDEITQSVTQTARGAAHARDVVAATKADAERSGKVVREAVVAMGGIENSSQRIGQIIGVIDEIAFQTNLLALNAGVEAARAGDAGRGFAVVASEVRGLAQRSADAAKEIKTLISVSGQQVVQGVKLVDETGIVLGRILTQVADITQVVSDIAVSIEQQATGLAEVNTAVNQMDQFTQQNAVMVEQSAASSLSLTQDAEELARLISRFRIDDGAPQEAAATSRVAASTSRAPADRARASARPLRRSA